MGWGGRGNAINRFLYDMMLVDFSQRIISAQHALLGCLWRGCIAALRTSRDLSLPYRLVNQRVVFVGDHRGGAMNRRLYGVVADFSSYSI